MRGNETQHRVALPKRKHLTRLDRIHVPGAPVYFITACAEGRARVLADRAIAEVLVEAWRYSYEAHGWMIGRYLVMPDHVHFLASPGPDTARELSVFVGCWKRTTTIRIRKLQAAGHRRMPRPTERPFAWQKEFFDHLLRSEESHAQKWEYIRQNPVRAGLVTDPDEWPYQGEIHVL
jgi:REP element-mobilizing transposase RayT